MKTRTMKLLTPAALLWMAHAVSCGSGGTWAYKNDREARCFHRCEIRYGECMRLEGGATLWNTLSSPCAHWKGPCYRSCGLKRVEPQPDSSWQAEDLPPSHRLAMECDEGNAVACYNLGWMYDHGDGVVVNKVLAARLYGRACDGGDTSACFNLGLNYEHGKGVPIDLQRALQLYERACLRGHQKACAKFSEVHP